MNTKHPFDLDEFLPYRISLLANTVSQGIAARYRNEHGISAAEWRILAVLSRYPGSTASEICEHTAMDKVAIHRAIKSLLARDLVDRRTDSEDRRRRALQINQPRGQGMVDDIIPRALRFEKELLDALSSEEARLLHSLITKLQTAAEDNLPG